MVLSKGQGNFEVFSEYEEFFEGRLVYLLMSKCEPVSCALGVPRGSAVVYFVSG